eukprot:2696546-Rhodomonas_salina.1
MLYWKFTAQDSLSDNTSRFPKPTNFQTRILRDHPDWFLMDPESGQPLNSEMVSFGGWRQGPWYFFSSTLVLKCRPAMHRFGVLLLAEVFKAGWTQVCARRLAP